MGEKRASTPTRNGWTIRQSSCGFNDPLLKSDRPPTSVAFPENWPLLLHPWGLDDAPLGQLIDSGGLRWRHFETDE